MKNGVTSALETEFGIAVLWLFLGYLIGERSQKGRE